MATALTNRVTLVRGESYTLRHPKSTPQNPLASLKFERGIPQYIDDPAILKTLENLADLTNDSDGEVFEKPNFNVERNVRRAEDEEVSAPRVRRLSPTRTVKLRPRKG